jgi:hypothetical protein
MTYKDTVLRKWREKYLDTLEDGEAELACIVEENPTFRKMHETYLEIQRSSIDDAANLLDRLDEESRTFDREIDRNIVWTLTDEKVRTEGRTRKVYIDHSTGARATRRFYYRLVRYKALPT